MASGRLADYLGVGDEADIPVSLDLSAGAVGFFYAKDSNKLFAWDGVQWVLVLAGGAPAAADVTYDNVSSGLSATDVQAAIDEVAAGAGGGGAVSSVNGQTGVVQIDAEDVPYSNTTSGLAATDVQGAIDELAATTPGPAAWGAITGTLADQTDLQAALDAKAGNAYTIVTEASPFTADPGTHDGLTRYIRAAGDVTFDSAEPYTAGMVFNIRATASIELVEDGVTLTPPSGGTLSLAAGMAVQVVMTSATAGDVIGQTVASS